MADQEFTPADVQRDERAIMRLLAEYCHLVDDARYDDLAELFTVDGHFSFGRLTATGRPDLRAWFERNQPPELRGKHLTANTVIDVDGDDARAVSDFVFLGFADGRLAPLLTGRYRDELRRVDGRWLIRSRDAAALERPR